MNKHHFRPIKGVRFSTKDGKYISVGIWSSEVVGFENLETGKKHLFAIEKFNEALDEGAIKIDKL
jgi:hypothetical protein